jgi:hypothetical protein
VGAGLEPTSTGALSLPMAQPPLRGPRPHRHPRAAHLGSWSHRIAPDPDRRRPQRLSGFSRRRPGLRHRASQRREENRQDLDRDRLRGDQAYPRHRRCRPRPGPQSRPLDRRKRLPLHPGLEVGRGPLHHPHRPRPREHHRTTALLNRCHQGEVSRHRLRHYPTSGTQPPPGVRRPAYDRELPPMVAGQASGGGLERICRSSNACMNGLARDGLLGGAHRMRDLYRAGWRHSTDAGGNPVDAIG